eukprot:6491380-Amphidinium_carterae.2
MMSGTAGVFGSRGCFAFRRTCALCACLYLRVVRSLVWSLRVVRSPCVELARCALSLCGACALCAFVGACAMCAFVELVRCVLYVWSLRDVRCAMCA